MASVPTEDDSDAKHPSSPSLPASSPSLPLATPVVPTPLPPPAFTTPEHDLSASLSSLTLTSSPPPSFSPASIRYDSYASESQLPFIQSLIDRELSEPYSVFTYRYFLNNWPHLCLLAMIPNPHPAPASASFHPADLCVGTIICKLSSHFPRSSSSSSSSSSSPPPLKRGYIAMLATAVPYRRHGVGVRLVELALERMRAEGADVVVLETEVVNGAALRLYEGMGFVRDARLRRYYLNGGDAFRLKLWTTTLEQRKEREAQKRAKEKDHVGKGKAEAGKGAEGEGIDGEGKESAAGGVDGVDGAPAEMHAEDAFDDEGDDD